MGANSLRVDQLMFERYKTVCVYSTDVNSNASVIDCTCSMNVRVRIVNDAPNLRIGKDIAIWADFAVQLLP